MTGRTRDGVIALMIAVSAFAWYCAFAPTGLPPEMWGEVATAASLRAPCTIFPGLARHLSSALFCLMDFSTAVAAIVFLGKLLTAASAGFAYRILRYVLHCAGTPLEIDTPSRRTAGDVICIVVTAMFALSEPLLVTSEALSVDSLSLFLSFAALFLFFRFLDRGGAVTGGAMLFMFGVITAETSSGFLLSAVAVALYLLSVRGLTGFKPRPPSAYVCEFFKWRATTAFLVAFLGVIALNLAKFAMAGGMEANGMDLVTTVVGYFARYGELAGGTASRAGWFLVVCAVILPLVLALGMLPTAMNAEKFLKWRMGMCYWALGAVAAVQLGSVSPLWFHTWTKSPCIHSHYLMALCAFVSAVTLAFALVVLALELFFKNYARLLRVRYSEKFPGIRAIRGIRCRRVLFAVLLPVGLLALAWPVGSYRVRAEMRAVLEDAVKEIAREAGNARWIFTDGALDDGIELAAAAAGHRVYSLAMLGGTGDYADYLRTRGGLKGEDLHSAQISAAAAFRNWVLQRPERVEESAFMLGFEMWRAAAKTEPAGSGFLAKTVYAEGERERGLAEAGKLAERAIGLSRKYSVAKREAAGDLLNRFFSVMTWRLSRMAVYRRDALACAGDQAAVEREGKLAADLEAANAHLAELSRLRVAMAEQPRERVTSREKLKLALMRADFRMAEAYAQDVLVSDPGDVEAHFALGMHNFFLGNYPLSEVHLVKALDSKPKDGVIWNNLAMCQMKAGKLAEAEKAGMEALKLLPASSAVSNTLFAIRGKVKGDKWSKGM